MTRVPARVIYPRVFDVVWCWSCFRPRPDLATTSDKRVAGGDLVDVCGACYHSLAAGRSVELAPVEELPGLLESWARWDTNGNVHEDDTARMLAAYLPHLDSTERNGLFESLQEELLEFQERRAPLYSQQEENDARALVDEVIGYLMQGAAPQCGGAR